MRRTIFLLVDVIVHMNFTMLTVYIYTRPKNVLFSIVAGNRANYCPRDLKKTDYVNEMIRRSGFPSSNGLLSVIINGAWLNNTMTTLDVKNFNEGDNINRLQGGNRLEVCTDCAYFLYSLNTIVSVHYVSSGFILR